MGFHNVFMDNSWSHYQGFYCSLSEAQKGAEDKGQIKALLGGLPVTIGLLPKSKQGQVYTLVMQDYFTKWPQDIG